jgi:hypothetical protein
VEAGGHLGGHDDTEGKMNNANCNVCEQSNYQLLVP